MFGRKTNESNKHHTEVGRQKTGLLVVICLVYLPVSFAAGAGIKNPDTFILANCGTVRTQDPAVSYDDSGSQRIWNLDKTLIVILYGIIV